MFYSHRLAPKVRKSPDRMSELIVVSDAAKVTCRELLDDLLAHYDAGNAKPTTTRVFRWCIEANLKPYFGDLKAATLSTPKLKAYRDKRKADGVTETTCNRELSILRIALNLGRKSTPAKVVTMPFFPMVREDNARQGFLTDQQYAKLARSASGLPEAAVRHGLSHWRTAR